MLLALQPVWPCTFWFKFLTSRPLFLIKRTHPNNVSFDEDYTCCFYRHRDNNGVMSCVVVVRVVSWRELLLAHAQDTSEFRWSLSLACTNVLILCKSRCLRVLLANCRHAGTPNCLSLPLCMTSAHRLHLCVPVYRNDPPFTGRTRAKHKGRITNNARAGVEDVPRGGQRGNFRWNQSQQGNVKFGYDFISFAWTAKQNHFTRTIHCLSVVSVEVDSLFVFDQPSRLTEEWLANAP